MRTPLEKEDLVQYWPSDDNDSTDDELQNDPLKQILTITPNIKCILTFHFRAFPLVTAYHQLPELDSSNGLFSIDHLCNPWQHFSTVCSDFNDSKRRFHHQFLIILTLPSLNSAQLAPILSNQCKQMTNRCNR